MMTERDIQEERHATILGCCVSEIGSAEDWPEYAGCGWHDGPPEWCERDYPDRFDREYRTVLYPDVPYGVPPDPSGWVRVATFNAGEPDCPWCGAGTWDESERDGCPICEGSGVVYEGEGLIVVYARPLESDNNATDGLKP